MIERKLSWTPRRRGETYCSPACGGGCTYEAYAKARTQAATLARKLGRGWTPEVHESLGWHWNVRWGKPGFGVVLYDHLGPGPTRFLAGIESNGYPHGMTFTANGATARQAIRRVLNKVTSIVDTYTKLLESLGGAR